MKDHSLKSLNPQVTGNIFNNLKASIGTKIIVPYLLLTLAVAGIGAFIVVRLVAASLQERFFNQLLDAGRVVSESMVDYENERLQMLRTVVGTEGVPESLAAGDQATLAARVPQIIANSNTDAVELVNRQGREIYGWQRPPGQVGYQGEERAGADFNHWPEVRRILAGFVDEFGEKRAFLSQTPHGPMLFTVGPVYQGEVRVGAALVGTYVSEMTVKLTENAVAKVTLYDVEGKVIDTSLGGEQRAFTEILQESPAQYQRILAQLQGAPDYQSVVAATNEEAVPLKRVRILGQEYALAYGDWRLRSQSIGFFSVALPTNFVVSTTATSRNLLSLLFSIATIGVFIIGFVIAQRIIQPLNRLVQSALAVAKGDLTERTGIQRSDEIGHLAHSFDVMTDRLAERNRQLLEQASKLEAILNSTVDGIIVLNRRGIIITINPAARQILTDVSGDFLADILRKLPGPATPVKAKDELDAALALARSRQSQRYRVGSRIVSALTAPVRTPDGEELGTVIALRDITREAEADQLKDTFITNISHDLRTPLTSIRGYSDLLLKTANGTTNPQQVQFLQTINRNAKTLMQHVSKIIDISELQAGTLKLEKTDLAFPEVVEQVVGKWRDPMAAKGLSLCLELPAENLPVHGDPDRLRWAVDNLLENACNYTLTGGRVEVRLFREQHEVRLDIIDTGIGIAISDQPYLFTRFFRADNELVYDVAGVGLGLFITRSLVELHNGRVSVKSKLHEGSIFSLALPILQPALTAV